MREIRLSLESLPVAEHPGIRELADILHKAILCYRERDFARPGPQVAFACADAFLMVANESAADGGLSAADASHIISEVKRALRRHAFRYDFTMHQRRVLRCIAHHIEGARVKSIMQETGLTVGVVDSTLLQMRLTGMIAMERVRAGNSPGLYRIIDAYLYRLFELPEPPPAELDKSAANATMGGPRALPR